MPVIVHSQLIRMIAAAGERRVRDSWLLSSIPALHLLLRGAAYGLVLLFGLGLLHPSASAQQPSDADVARAVRYVRAAEANVGIVRLPGPATVVEDLPDRIVAAMKFFPTTLSDEDKRILRIRLAEEFIRQDAQENLWGFKFGAGLSLTTGRKNAIREATVDTNKIVRITKENDSSIGYLLEAHYFFTPDWSFLNLTTGNWGVGPFVAIQAGNEKALSGLGFGLMIGFRQLGAGLVPVSNLSWNIGIGALYDPAVKVLGNGIVANQPLPAGETVLRTTEVGGWGLMIMSSFNF